MMKIAAFCAGILLAGIPLASADVLDSTGKTFATSGYGWYNFGQVVHGHWYGANGPGRPDFSIRHEWTELFGAKMCLDGSIKGRYLARAAIELHSNLFYSSLTRDVDYRIRQRTFSTYVDEAYGSAIIGNLKDPLMRITVGYFIYNYNPDVRNLGEYLFRAGAFPGYMLNFFDWSKCRVLGLRATIPIGPLRQDVMITNETDFPMPPDKDYSLSYVAGINLGDKLDLGAGVQFQNLISVNEDLTTPRDPGNQYFPEGSHIHPDDISDSMYNGENIGASRKYYSWRNTKLMARFSFDPKGFFDSHIFGKEDLKLYSEAALLGLHDYTLYQNDTTWHTIPWQDRIPVTIGINLPTFKLLDVLALEWEYYGCPYKLEIWPMVMSGRPSGRDDLVNRGGGYNPNDFRTDDIKWSFYAKRTLFNLFTVIGQVARDHYFMNDYSNGIIREAISKQNDWHWDLKLLYSF